jgi:hypothetical protein
MSNSPIGQRIRERLIARGYRRADGEPDVREFSFDFRFDKGHVYSWLSGKMTPFKQLTELCDALQCTPYWLLTGKEQIFPKAIPRQRRGKVQGLLLALSLGGGLALSPSPRVARAVDFSPPAQPGPLDVVHLIGSRRRFRNKIRYIGAGSAYAA